MGKCFACDKKLDKGTLVTCKDEQTVYVGSDCFKKIKQAATDGYQPPKGGPRLYLLECKPVIFRD